MSLQLPAILSPPTPCIPLLALTVLAASSGRRSRLALHGSASGSGLRLSLAGSPMHQAVSCSTWSVYGLAVRLRLLSTPSLDNAVSFNYGQPVLCPMGTFTPRLACTLRRTRAC